MESTITTTFAKYMKHKKRQTENKTHGIEKLVHITHSIDGEWSAEWDGRMREREKISLS